MLKRVVCSGAIHLTLAFSAMMAAALASPPLRVQAAETYQFAEVEARLHEQYPAYIGFQVFDGTLYLAVNATDVALQRQILKAVQLGHASFLPVLLAQSGQLRVLTGRVDALALMAAYTASRRVRGATSIVSDARINRLVVQLAYPSQRDEAEAVFRAAGIPLSTVLIITPTSKPLPQGPALDAPHAAVLQVPSTIRSGQTLTITLSVRNPGGTPLEFDHGACDFHVEVQSMKTKEVVLPRPSDRLCIDVGYRVNVPPRQSCPLDTLKWKVETTDWKPLPPGEYEVRAVFGPVERLAVTQNRAMYVTPTRYLIPPPVRFKVLSGSR